VFSGFSVSSALSVSSVSSVFSVFHEGVEEAVKATQPRGAGDLRSRLFALARRLKALPGTRDCEASALRPVVMAWHAMAHPAVGDAPFLDVWSHFVSGLGKVKYPWGEGPVGEAFRRASSSPPPERVVELYPGEGEIHLLAALCRELQRFRGEGFFFLDCRVAGQFVGVGHVTAWRWLNVLCADGILRAGEKGSLEGKKANEYEYLGSDL
jgi:hypothetical protein